MDDQAICDAILALRDAVCVPGVPFRTEDGGKVGDLTEAMTYAGQGLHAIAGAIDRLTSVIAAGQQTDAIEANRYAGT